MAGRTPATLFTEKSESWLFTSFVNQLLLREWGEDSAATAFSKINREILVVNGGDRQPVVLIAERNHTGVGKIHPPISVSEQFQPDGG